MSEKISPETVSVLSSTMLIPLWAKAVEQGRAQPLLRDDEAVRMLDKIDYDFSKFAKVKASQVGCCAACCAGLGLGLGKKCSQPAKIATEMAKNAISLLKSIRDSWN